MYVKKKTRTRLIILAIVVLLVIMWRGVTTAAKDTHTCSFKLLYAVCTPKKAGNTFPSFMEILKAGVKF